MFDAEDVGKAHDGNELIAQHQHLGIADDLDALLDLLGSDAQQLDHADLRNGEALVVHADHQRGNDGQGQRQLDAKERPLPNLRLDVDLAAQARQVGLDHVHAHAAAGNVGNLLGGGKPWQEDEMHLLLIGHALHGLRRNEPARDGRGSDPVRVEFRGNDQKDRTTILAANGSFHGRTFGALAATDAPAYKEGFEPLPAGFAFTPFNDIAALEKAIDARTAAFIVEPVQGESGVMPATREFLLAARELCTERGASLIFDEVQVGMGRLGRLFASQFYDVQPDVFTLAKSLANGLPIGAMLVRGDAATGLRPGDHGTTFGGSPVPAAAALEHLAIREGIDLDAHVETVSAVIRAELEAIAAENPAVFDAPRGHGLILGLPVREPYKASDFVPHGFDFGLIINAAGRNTLRFIPPLIITTDQALDGMSRLRATIAATLAPKAE